MCSLFNTMRDKIFSGIKFRLFLSSNHEGIPFDYPYKLCGLFHHWLGPNDLHNMLSLYSLGWLKGRSIVKDGELYFPGGATWDIGIHNDEIAERLMRGPLLKEFRFYGMALRKVERLQPPSFKEGEHRFLAASPIFLRKVEDDGTRTHVLYDHPESAAILNRVFRSKADEARRKDFYDLDIKFDLSFPKPKTCGKR